MASNIISDRLQPRLKGGLTWALHVIRLALNLSRRYGEPQGQVRRLWFFYLLDLSVLLLARA